MYFSLCGLVLVLAPRYCSVRPFVREGCAFAPPLFGVRF